MIDTSNIIIREGLFRSQVPNAQKGTPSVSGTRQTRASGKKRERESLQHLVYHLLYTSSHLAYISVEFLSSVGEMARYQTGW